MEKQIPFRYIIRDKRILSDFKFLSFSKIKIKELITIFNKSLLENKLLESLNYGIELMMSCNYGTIWQKIINISIRNININKPDIPFYLYTRYVKFNKLINEYDYLELRNSQEFRNLLTDIIFNVSNSKKSKTIGFQTIKDSEFKLTNIITKFTAKDSTIIYDKLKYGDPEETKIILNEFNYCLRNKNYNMCVYWLSWIFQWEKKNKKNNKPFICGYREIQNVDKKYYNDLVWFIWEIFIKESKTKSLFVAKNIESLYKMYKYDFKPSKKSKRSYFFLFAIKYFTDQYFVNQYPDNYNINIRLNLGINYIVLDKMKHSINNDQIIEKHRYNDKIKNMERKKKIVNKNEIMKSKINKVDLIDNLILSRK